MGDFLAVIGVVGLIVCLAIVFVILFFVSKKDQNVTDGLVAALSEEQRNLIKNQTFTHVKGQMFNSNGMVGAVEEKDGKVIADIIFYMEEHQGFYSKKVKVSTSDERAKNLKVGNLVPVLMKHDKEMHYYDFKKML